MKKYSRISHSLHICASVAILLVILVLCGCGNDNDDNNDISRNPETQATATPEPTTAPTATPEGGSSAPDNNGNGVSLDGDVMSLLDQLYENLGDAFELPVLMSTPLSNDMEYGEQGIAYFLGTHDVPIIEGVASEPAIGAIPYSVCLVRLEPNTDVEAAKALIKDNAPSDKWICVWADNVIVSNIDDLVILIMTSEDRSAGLGEAINQAFLALAA